MTSTHNLDLPYIMPSQAQKHLTHNEALATLDALVQLAVLDRDLSAPPASPAEGARYIVAPGGSGDWTGQSANIAVRREGGWVFLVPKLGWAALAADEGIFVVWNGASWAALGTAGSALQNLALLGVGTAADAANPFSAKLNKALWTAKAASEGGDGNLRYTLNKETSAAVLSLLMQTGFSGRAEIGLLGDDDLTLKVSPNGTAWTEALRVNKTTGLLSFPGQLRFPAAQNPSSDVNTLDDYEEGVFTPGFSATTTAPTGVTYAERTGRYTKIGRQVLVEGRLTLTSKGSGGVGQATMTGLPFTATISSFTTQMRFGGATLPASTILAAAMSGSSFFFQSSGSTGTADLPWSAASNSFDVLFSHLYTST